MGIASRSLAQTMRLVGTGFTEAQARAIAESVDAAAGEAVEALRHELARWHAYLALYILMQIGVALLVILIVQAASPSAWSLAETPDGRGVDVACFRSGVQVRSGPEPPVPTWSLGIERIFYLAHPGLDPERLDGCRPGLIDAGQGADQRLGELAIDDARDQ
jgi:hypothetical protein